MTKTPCCSALDAKRASALLKKLKAKVKIRALKGDLEAIGQRIDQLSGRRMQQVVESLMRHKPGQVKKPSPLKKAVVSAKKKPVAKGKPAKR